MNKNDKFVGECLNYTFEGLGVVKLDNFPVFVKDMVVGEVGEVVVTLVKKTYAYGRLLNVEKESAARVEAKCPLFRKCGGCQLQHMSTKEQETFKKNRVQDVMTRVGKLDIEVKDVLSMEDPTHYRNKGQIPVSVVNGKVVSGFYRINTNEIVDMEECLIQHEMINKIALKMKRMISLYKIGSCFRHILVKVGFTSNEIMVVWITNTRKVPNADKLIHGLTKEFPMVKSIILNLNTREDNVILGDEEVVLFGKEMISDELNGLKFNISSKSFYQVNPVQTKVLYEKAIEFAGLSGHETVVDLYCGIGTISLLMAKLAKKVIGIEIVPEAIEDAKRNALLNKIDNVEFVCADAGDYAAESAKTGLEVDVVCIDPPRKGCDQKALDAILTIEPKKIVYVSCDPSTLARDLRILEDNGYRCDVVQPVDMFPHTYHVECVILMTRCGKSDK